MLKKVATLALMTLFASCATVKVDPSTAIVTDFDREVVSIPDICKTATFSNKPRVAVARFQNNTSYGDMTSKNTNVTGYGRSNTVGAGVSKNIGNRTSVSGGASNTVSAYTSQADSYMRKIAPKIGEYAQAATENIVSNLGSMVIYDRSSLSAVLDEQKFQMTIADPDTAVELGKLAGVEYVLTGSVDSIDARYIQPVNDKGQSTGDAWVDLALSLTHALININTGWLVNVELSVKMINVSTGQVVVNKKMQGKQLAGGGAGLNPELISEAAKRAMGVAIKDLSDELLIHFTPRGYITQMRNNKKLVMVNMGSNDSVRAGDKLKAYEFIEISDPFTGDSSCDMLTIPVEITVSNQISGSTAWGKVSGKKAAILRLKNGTAVMKSN